MRMEELKDGYQDYQEQFIEDLDSFLERVRCAIDVSRLIKNHIYNVKKGERTIPIGFDYFSAINDQKYGIELITNNIGIGVSGVESNNIMSIIIMDDDRLAIVVERIFHQDKYVSGFHWYEIIYLEREERESYMKFRTHPFVIWLDFLSNRLDTYTKIQSLLEEHLKKGRENPKRITHSSIT